MVATLKNTRRAWVEKWDPLEAILGVGKVIDLGEYTTCEALGTLVSNGATLRSDLLIVSKSTAALFLPGDALLYYRGESRVLHWFTGVFEGTPIYQTVCLEL